MIGSGVIGRIYTEEKAEVVVWVTEFLAALAILHQDDLTNRMNSSFSSHRCSAIYPFLHIVLVQFIIFFISSWCKIASDELYLLFCINPSCMLTVICFLKNTEELEAWTMPVRWWRFVLEDWSTQYTVHCTVYTVRCSKSLNFSCWSLEQLSGWRSIVLFHAVNLRTLLAQASLIVWDFTISVYGSSCNYLFLSLTFAPLPFFIFWHS